MKKTIHEKWKEDGITIYPRKAEGDLSEGNDVRDRDCREDGPDAEHSTCGGAELCGGIEAFDLGGYLPKEVVEELGLSAFEPAALGQLRAVMLGHAVADALGVPVEFLSREELDAAPVVYMRGYGSHPVPAGCFSDDTSMSLATIDALKAGEADYDGMMRGFSRWVNEGEYTATGEVFDVGGTCMQAIRRFLHGATPMECGLSGESSNGNGSLMRIHPMVLYLYYTGHELEEAMEGVRRCSALTHAHPRSLLACEIYASVLWALLDNPCRGAVLYGLGRAEKLLRREAEAESERRKIIRRLGDPTLSQKEKAELVEKLYAGIDVCGAEHCAKELSAFDRLFSEDFSKIDRTEIRSTGYVVDTLEAAIWCLLTTRDYKECVLKAVNLGSDTDTVAAVAGGLAGALYGVGGIPCEWLDGLIGREYIERLCREAYEGWHR